METGGVTGTWCGDLSKSAKISLKKDVVGRAWGGGPGRISPLGGFTEGVWAHS